VSHSQSIPAAGPDGGSLRVLHVIPSTTLADGGPSVVVRTLAYALSERGVEVTVLAADGDGAGHLDVPLGTPVPDGPVVYRWFRRQTRFYSVSLPLARWLDRHVAEFDVVHTHAVFSYPSVVAASRARRANVPYVLHPVGTLCGWGMQHRRPIMKQLSFQLVERKLLASAAAVHWTSSQERAEAPPAARGAPARVIPEPVRAPDPAQVDVKQFYARHPEIGGRRVVLSCSRIDRKKGLDLLLEAFVFVLRSHPDAVLVVAGAGPAALEADLRRQAQGLGLNGSVLWCGHLPEDEKWQAMRACEVFVLPSRSENFGLAVAEAMASGKPVVISDQVGIHDDVAAAGAGTVVPLGIRSFADAIVAMLSDPSRASLVGSAAKRHAEQHYAPSAVADALLHLYGDITGQDQSRPHEHPGRFVRSRRYPVSWERRNW
jgi:glycosyltransferase involved in cell wall biosynthesis